MMAFTAQAAGWTQTTDGWWYQDSNGRSPRSKWQWIDGRCYYFDEYGYCYMDASNPTPDGYLVDQTGAWIVDGVVQVKEETSQIISAQGAAGENAAPFIGKWHRVDEYNTMGRVGNNVYKDIFIEEVNGQLRVGVYRQNASRPVVTYTLYYESPYWWETDPVFDTPHFYYIEEETGKLVSCRRSSTGLSAVYEKYVRID